MNDNRIADSTSLSRAARRLALAAFALIASSADASSIRLMNWNMGNLPNSTIDRTNLETIYRHIGSTGGSPLFDVMAMQETDAFSAVESASAASAVYPNGLFQSVVSTPDGGSDRTGFVYNARTVALLGTRELSDGLIHNILCGHFRPVGTGGESDFYYYSIHLKSGSTTADRAARVQEAQTLRTDADALGSANIIFGGDFNWTGVDEAGANPITSAWDVFTAPGRAQSFDPAAAGGDWRDNAAFESLHTNDPGGAMDDRFDLQLLSGELFDGIGLDYIPGTYRVIGNNGTHDLNGLITTGTGAPPAVLNALAAFSDHLPVTADYTFAGITPEPTSLGVLMCMAALTRRRRCR